MKRAIAVACSAAALTLAAMPVAHAAPADVVRPAVTCPGSFDSATHVQPSVDWLRVHTSPSATSAAIGQIPGGAAFTFSSSSGTVVGSTAWYCGYGYNGSTKLTGWVDGAYLNWP